MITVDERPKPRTPAIAVRRETVPRSYFQGGLWLILGNSAASTGTLISLEAVYARGAVLPRLQRTRETEFIYVLAGQVSVQMGEDAEQVAAEGSFVFVPKNTPVQARVVSDEARLYNCLLPGGFDAMLIKHGVKTEALDLRDLPAPSPKLTAGDWAEFGISLA